jgi:hypothetical protein
MEFRRSRAPITVICRSPFHRSAGGGLRAASAFFLQAAAVTHNFFPEQGVYVFWHLTPERRSK